MHKKKHSFVQNFRSAGLFVAQWVKLLWRTRELFFFHEPTGHLDHGTGIYCDWQV